MRQMYRCSVQGQMVMISFNQSSVARCSSVNRCAIAPRWINGFRWQRGKIAVGGGWHRWCLLSASGAMGLNRRAQIFVWVSSFEPAYSPIKSSAATPAER